MSGEERGIGGVANSMPLAVGKSSNTGVRARERGKLSLGKKRGTAAFVSSMLLLLAPSVVNASSQPLVVLWMQR